MVLPVAAPVVAAAIVAVAIGMAVALLVVPWSSAAENTAGAAARQTTAATSTHPRGHAGTAAASCRVTPVVAGQKTAVPMRVTRILRVTFAVVTVCIDGSGPFRFMVDTGASGTAISPPVARTLHLATRGKSGEGFGASCTTTFHSVAVANWSIDHVALAAQDVTTADLPKTPVLGVDGLLGSDVLSRFGAVTVDYDHSRLDLPGPEGTPTAAGAVQGPTATPTPPVLLQGQPTSAQVPMKVLSAHRQVLAFVPVRFGTRPPSSWVVDTGSSLSGVAVAAVRHLHLATVGGHLPLATVGCRTAVSFAKSGQWAVGSTRLDPQDLVAIRLPGVSSHGVEGLLGSDVFSRFDQITVDYAGGRLLLG